MCTDTIPVLAYVKIELFFADICYYQRINPKPITDMAKKIALWQNREWNVFTP